MRRRPGPLLIAEVVGIFAFLAFLGAFVLEHRGARGAMVPIDPAALQLGEARERWMGIFVEDQKVGYAVSRSTAIAGGGLLMEGRSRFRMAAFGRIQDVITAQAAITDAEGRLTRFDFFMLSDEVRLSARGEVRGDRIVMELSQGGETSELSFPIEAPPHVQLSLEAVLHREPLYVGKTIEVPFFSPATMAQGTIRYTVEDVEILENGEEAWWVRSSFEGIESRELVTSAGETIRQEGAMGMSMVRMTAEEAQAMPTGDEAVDIIEKSAVAVDGQLPAGPLRLLVVEIHGVEPSRIVHQPPGQVREGSRVRVEAPLLAELPARPPRPEGPDPAFDPWLGSTATIQASHPEIVTRAEAIVAGAPSRIEAVRRLNDWVHQHVEKVPTFGVPSGLEVLRSGRGDCNEHTALFVSLARAVGIPTRIAAGVVYSEQVGPQGAFYYHAWPEVLVDEAAPDGGLAWLAVDPTFGQLPADATHIKLVEGDLDRQVEILAVMGRLRFTLVEAR